MPESNQYMIFDACNSFMLLAQEKGPLMGTFISLSSLSRATAVYARVP
jgi:hypothetical protein